MPAGRNPGWMLAACARIAAEQRHLELLRHVDARVLQQRSEIVGGGPDHRVLEIEQADLRDVLPVRQPDQIGRMEVAQHPGGVGFDHGLQRLAPQRDIDRARRLGNLDVQLAADTSRAATRPRSARRPCRSAAAGARHAARPAACPTRRGCAARPARRRRPRSVARSAPADRPRPPARCRDPRGSASRRRDRPRRFPAPRSRAARRPFAIATNGFTSSARCAIAL